MEVQYIFAILNTVIVGVYLYAISSFNFADRGVEYLTTLATKESAKFNNDPAVMNVLNNRDLPNMKSFASERPRIKSLLIVAMIINIINYVIYPYDVLLYAWMQYIIVGACVITNLDGILMFFNLRNNRQIVSKICNAYYELTLAHNEIEEVVVSIDKAFDELMQDLNNKVFTEPGDKNKNDNDEK